MILGAATMRNEMVRLPFFLEHHRKLGVEHFLIVENASDDGTREFLADQPDVSLWSSKRSYKKSRFGLDWLTWLMIKHAHGHWCLTLDADEIMIYPYWDTRPLAALTGWLDGQGIEAFPAMMLDMYPKGPLGEQRYEPGQDPTEILSWFDSGNYVIQRQMPMENLWIQGGVRARCFLRENHDARQRLTKCLWSNGTAAMSMSIQRMGFCRVGSTVCMIARGASLPRVFCFIRNFLIR